MSRRWLLAIGVVAIVVGVAFFAWPRGDGGPVSSEELAEMTAAAAQAAGRPEQLRDVRVASNHGVSWASARARTPAATLTVFFEQDRGVWREIGSSSGCLDAADLGMPGGVGRALGAC